MEISKLVTRKKRTTSETSRPIMAVRRNERRREPPHPGEVRARKSGLAAVSNREAGKVRIVCVFLRHIERWGSRPTDAELRMFARLAVAEQRSKRGMARAMFARRCRHSQAPVCPASVLRQEHLDD